MAEIIVYFTNLKHANLPLDKTIFVQNIQYISSDMLDGLERGMNYVNWQAVTFVQKRDERRVDDDDAD
jgi:hypothetical protein